MSETRFLLGPFPPNVDLRTLWLRVWGEAGPETFQTMLRRSLAHVGAYSGSRLVGFANVATDGGIHGFISDVLVDPDYQRRGIGTELASRARDAAKDRGIVWLHVDFEPKLRPFYARIGFRETTAGVIRFVPE